MMLILRSLKGIFLLVRFVPVLSWSLSALLLSLGFAIHDLHGVSSIDWLLFFILVACCVLLQGVIAHSFNDTTVWRSGIDRYSRGSMSGGSRVISRGIFTEKQLFFIGSAGLVTMFLLGWYLNRVTSSYIWLFILVGVWSAMSYTYSPLRLADYPLLGEWLAAFPAMVACSLGAYFVLTGGFGLTILCAGILHGLLCTAWLMQHHITDITADLQASPPKNTTVAYVCKRFGLDHVRYVPAAYYLIAALAALVMSFEVSSIFTWSLFTAVLGCIAAWNTNPRDVASVTFNQIKMISLTALHALFLFTLESFG
jgi:1,4-dihydroxy-2-naphthoate polyprenyltransferase